MEIYELIHIFFREKDEFIYSPKKLGLFYTYESTKSAIQYYSSKPGFCETKNAFSTRRRTVLGKIINNTVFEVIVYIHSEDYTFEAEIELGLFGDETSAKNSLDKYCSENTALVSIDDLVLEKIINKCIVERKEWADGFSLYNSD